MCVSAVDLCAVRHDHTAWMLQQNALCRPAAIHFAGGAMSPCESTCGVCVCVCVWAKTAASFLDTFH